MAKLSILAGATSQSVNIFIQDSSVTTGAGLTGLAFNTASLTAYYTFTGTNTAATAITLATLVAVSSAYSSGGFKEIDATNMPGLYRLDIPNAALATSKGRSVVVLLKGATNMVPCVLEIELTAVDNQSTAFGLSLAKTTNITGFNDIAASAVVSSGAITTSGGAVSTVTTVTNQLTAAAIATGVWQDSTSADFTTASSIGKCLYIANVVPGGTGGHFIAGTNAATTITTGLTTTFTGNLTGSVASVTGAVGSVTGLTASNLDTTISSRMATYTQPTGFLAATFPTGTIANTTNITAGTITTATNLTNAPTSGDFTSTMKTSIGTAVAASAVASVTAGVTVSTNNDKTGYSLTQAFPSNFSSLSITSGGLVAITSNRKKNAAATFEFVMTDSTTGAVKTGLTVASVISKDGGAAASTSNSVTEIGLGQYQLVLTSTEMNANNVFLQFTATGATTYSLSIQTQP